MRPGSLALVVSLLAPVAIPLAAQTVKPTDSLLTVERYLDYETVAAPKVSPDGNLVIFTRRTVDRIKDGWDANLWLMNADGSAQRFLVKGSDAVWSPDGTRIAYVADGEPSGPQIFVRYMDASGATTQLTRIGQAPANLKWSP